MADIDWQTRRCVVYFGNYALCSSRNVKYSKMYRQCIFFHVFMVGSFKIKYLASSSTFTSMAPIECNSPH